jgi:predicted MFS family arabinose efflux permease
MLEAAPAAAPQSLSRTTLALLAAACGITVGNVYLCQPLLDQIAVSFAVPPHLAGLVATGAQVGYALGILFILPLADAIEPRRLVRVLLLLTALMLIGAALSPSVPVLVAVSLTIACTTVVPQILIPITTGFAEPKHRGRVIGTLQTGLILGILLSRTISGGVAAFSGTWRSPYLLAALLTGSLALVLPPLIPSRDDRPAHNGYLSLLATLLPLLRHRPLRLSMALGFCIYAAFSAFWATLAFHLASPAFGLGPGTAGLFGLYGAPGAILAPLAGRLSDRFGTVRVNVFALISVAMAFVVAGTVGAFSLLALVVAVNLLDFGLQSGQVANQTRIFALGDDIRARVNTLYMVATFGGGAIGSFAGAIAWSQAGWRGVCAVGLMLVAAAALMLVSSVRAQGHDSKEAS